MRGPSLLILCGLLATPVGRPLGAQQSLVVDAGIAGAHFPVDKATAAGPYVRLSGSFATPRAFGSFDTGALASFGSAGGFGTIRGGVRTGAGLGWSAVADGEFATVAGSSHNGAANTAIAGARAMWSSPAWGGWVHGMAHQSSRTNSTPTGGGVDVGTWWSTSQLQLSATVAREWTRAELYTGSFRTGFLGTTAVAYTEGALALHGEADRATLDVVASLRRDPDADRLYESSLAASGAFWAGERFAFVLSAARQLPDFIRGADAASTFSVGLRFRQPTPIATRSLRVIPIVHVGDENGTRTVRVRAAGARTVEVMGDFTDWAPRALSRKGDVFETEITVTPGTHRMVVRIDGGEWRTAANTPVVDDDLGGKVGLLVVP